MKITINKKAYRTRGITGFIGTILMLPGMGLAIVCGLVIAVCAIVLITPGVAIAMIQAERDPSQDEA